MSPEQKEIMHLNRELGEALGHLQGLLNNVHIDLSIRNRIAIFLEKVEERQSHIQ